MGFGKRYISRDTIINTLVNGGSLSKLRKADALIVMDPWSYNFFEDYNNDQKYITDRDLLLDDTKYSSFHESIHTHKNFQNLKNLPNILENLYISPSWVDILLTFEILGSDGVDESSRGKFENLKNICIDKIKNYYMVESRNKSISEIIKKD